MMSFFRTLNTRLSKPEVSDDERCFIQDMSKIVLGSFLYEAQFVYDNRLQMSNVYSRIETCLALLISGVSQI